MRTNELFVYSLPLVTYTQTKKYSSYIIRKKCWEPFLCSVLAVKNRLFLKVRSHARTFIAREQSHISIYHIFMYKSNVIIHRLYHHFFSFIIIVITKKERRKYSDENTAWRWGVSIFHFCTTRTLSLSVKRNRILFMHIEWYDRFCEHYIINWYIYIFYCFWDFSWLHYSTMIITEINYRSISEDATQHQR